MKYRKLKDAVANFKTNTPDVYLPTIHAKIKGVLCPISMTHVKEIHDDGTIKLVNKDEKMTTDYLDISKDYDIYVDKDDILYIKKDDEYIKSAITIKDLSKFNKFVPEFE